MNSSENKSRVEEEESKPARPMADDEGRPLWAGVQGFLLTVKAEIAHYSHLFIRFNKIFAAKVEPLQNLHDENT